jgi:ABC-2 type transport system ATP-binding protein/sodium transport system ATP-binding protein
MLLDEPTSGLDVLGSQVVGEYIDHLRGEGKSVILTTHRLDEAERLCTRFGLLHKGRLVIEGTLPELRARTGCTGLVEIFLKMSHVGPALSAVFKRQPHEPADSRFARADERVVAPDPVGPQGSQRDPP